MYLYLFMSFYVYIDVVDYLSIYIFYPPRRDHRPSDPLEAQRVVQEGGRVVEGRVGGDLAISRSLGHWFVAENSLKV